MFVRNAADWYRLDVDGPVSIISPVRPDWSDTASLPTLLDTPVQLLLNTRSDT